ncbi:glucosamine-6-phosphate deaminase [Shouchella sp. 1P09AA]|uniref:glucosamine-6-phosphate deaminase n=1 Tax=unclassified Shouchella TaxID=2893065 RepID=UPI00399F311A
MNIIYVRNYEELSDMASSFLLEHLQAKPSMNMGLATGGTPKGTYSKLINKAKEAQFSFARVKTFNLDEYVGLSHDNKNSYHEYMRSQLFHAIDIKREHTFIPNGLAPSLREEADQYEQRIAAEGGIDVQLLGIGSNGHIGFNEPGTDFQETTHIIELADETRAANARYFNSKDDVPKQAITMGLATIMAAKTILLLISGEDKKRAFSTLLEGDRDPNFPASILTDHPNVTVIVDADAAGDYSQHVTANGA